MLTVFRLLNLTVLFLYWLMIATVTIRILLQQRPVTSALIWLLIIYIIPLVGGIAYLTFGELYLGKRRIIKAKNMWPVLTTWLEQLKKKHNIFCTKTSLVAEPLFELCKNRQGISGIKVNKLQLLTHYQESFHAIIRDINSACDHIEMVFYIWQLGGLVDEVTEALIKAAKRGIKCRLMIDSAGSWLFFHSHQPKKMRKAGIKVIESLKFNIFRCFIRRMDLRQHRKIIIIDNNISYVGSMNMVDPSFSNLDQPHASIAQWIDIIIRMEGAIATTLGMVYAFDWKMETGQQILPPPPPETNIMLFETEQVSGHTTQVIASGPGFPEELIQQSLITAIFSARKQLILTTPYFIPSDDLKNAICTAAMRGVEVLMIIPNRNKFFLVRWASRAFYAELLEAGVKIYQFYDGLLHTKSVSIDGELSLIGSVNLDMRSLWLNLEITVVIDDQKIGNDLKLVQLDYIKRSTPLLLKNWKNRPLWNRLIEYICFFFRPLL